MYALLADLTLLLHLAFILFAVFGGLLVLKWKRVIWIHVLAVGWAALIEFAGWICPLTPLENYFRARAGELGYQGGFIEHYLLPLIYPSGLTRSIQLTLGLAVVLVNVLIYSFIWHRRAANRRG